MAQPLLSGGSLIRLSVVIAAYNEERTLESVVGRIRAMPLDVEIIAVNDGSGDRTGQVLFIDGEATGAGRRQAAGPAFHMSTAQRHSPSGSRRQTVTARPSVVVGVPSGRSS